MNGRKTVNYAAALCVLVWMFLGILAALHIGTPSAAIPFLGPISFVIGIFFFLVNFEFE